MPNTGMIKTQGFKHEVYERKLKERRFANNTNNKNFSKFSKVGTEAERICYAAAMKAAINKRTLMTDIEEAFRLDAVTIDFASKQ